MEKKEMMTLFKKKKKKEQEITTLEHTMMGICPRCMEQLNIKEVEPTSDVEKALWAFTMKENNVSNLTCNNKECTFKNVFITHGDHEKFPMTLEYLREHGYKMDRDWK
jgi:hypothetical protein